MAEVVGNLYYALGLDDIDFRRKLAEAIKQVSELDKVAQQAAKIHLPSMLLLRKMHYSKGRH